MMKCSVSILGELEGVTTLQLRRGGSQCIPRKHGLYWWQPPLKDKPHGLPLVLGDKWSRTLWSRLSLHQLLLDLELSPSRCGITYWQCLLSSSRGGVFFPLHC